jgi:hypothetical protein
MNKCCEAAPRQARQGIAAYEGLRFESIVWKDGHSVDINLRTAVIVETRQFLNSPGDLLAYARRLKAQAEGFIRDDWPGRTSGIPAPVVSEAVPRPAEFAVEKEFEVETS